MSPLSWSLDHAGPLARTVRDMAVVLQTIAGFDARDPSSSDIPCPDYTASLEKSVRGLRIGVPKEYFFQRSTEEVERAVRLALEELARLGATIVEVSVPHVEYALAAGMTIILVEGSDIHAESLGRQPNNFGADVLPRLQMGALIGGADYVRAQRIRALIAREFRDVMTEVDVVLTPTNAVPVPRVDQTTIEVRDQDVWVMSLMPSLTIAHNLTGFPALTVPCGMATNGMPVGLQIVGRPFDEATILAVGHAYQSATEWHRLRPPVQ